MASTVTITRSEFNRLTERLNRLEQSLNVFVEWLGNEPPIGTDQWWEWSDRKALLDVRKGNYSSFDSAEEMVSYLNRKNENQVR